nr:hypothetical protein [Kaustia mangrovi]
MIAREAIGERPRFFGEAGRADGSELVVQTDAHHVELDRILPADGLAAVGGIADGVMLLAEIDKKVFRLDRGIPGDGVFRAGADRPAPADLAVGAVEPAAPVEEMVALAPPEAVFMPVIVPGALDPAIGETARGVDEQSVDGREPQARPDRAEPFDPALGVEMFSQMVVVRLALIQIGDIAGAIVVIGIQGTDVGLHAEHDTVDLVVVPDLDTAGERTAVRSVLPVEPAVVVGTVIVVGFILIADVLDAVIGTPRVAEAHASIEPCP